MAARHARKKEKTITGIHIVLIILILLFIFIGGFALFMRFFLGDGSELEGEVSDLNITPPSFPVNQLTGLPTENYINPTVVMISNIPEARPQTGLNQADIIYEIEMEGQVTRFVALYFGNPPKTAGPVRSARPYVMRFGLEWDAWFVHVGGSEDAKSFARRTENFHDIDGMSVTQGFALDSSRKRPHNTYIDFESLLEGRPETGKLPAFVFMSEDQTPPPVCRSIKLDYGKSTRIEYKWDDARQAYARWLNDKPHADRETDEQLYANNVIIQYAGHTFSGDALGHIDVKTTGSGKAEYYLGGRYLTGTWSKTDDDAFTIYRDEFGGEIVRAKGNTIVQVVRDNKAFIGNVDAQLPEPE